MVDYSLSSDNVDKATLEELDNLVKKYAGLLGIDASSGVQFLQILNEKNFNDGGLNKYNLTETNIKELQDAIDGNKEAAYIDLLLEKIFNSREKPDNYNAPDEAGIAQVYQMFMGGASFDEVMGAFSSDLDRDYDPKASRKVPVYENGKQKFENGTPVYKSFETHFSTDFHYFINSLTDSGEIEQFQKYLIENRVVPPSTFLGTEGEYSSALEAAVVSVMTYIDQEHYIAEGTEQWNQIMNDDPVFFTSSQASDYTMDAQGLPVPTEEGLKRTQDLKLFNWGIQEISKDYEKFAAYEEQMADEALINQLKSQYKVMTPLEREDEVESWFQQKLGRKGSKREIEEWANNIALNYSSVFKKLVKDVQGLQADMGLRDWETAYLASFGNEEDTEMKKKTFNDMTDISAQLAQEDPLLQAEDRFDDIYAEQMESYEIGKKSIQEDADILRMIYG